MKRFTLELDFFWGYEGRRDVRDSLLLKRKFPKVEILSWMNDDIEVGANFLKSQSWFVTSLTLKCEPTKTQAFMNLLSLLPNLKDLKLVTCKFKDIESVVLKPLKALTKLDIKNHTEALKLFLISSIKSLVVHQPASDIDHLNNFLMKQKHLEELKITLTGESDMRDHNEVAITGLLPKLRKFSLTAPKSYTISSENRLLKFLRTNGRFLEEIELQCEAVPEVYRFVFTQLKALKSLSVHSDLIPWSQNFYADLNPSLNIIVVKVHFSYWRLATTYLLKAFPHIQTLSTIYDDRPEGTLYASYANLCLYEGNVQLPCLKYLHINEFDSVTQLRLMLRHYRTIEYFSIHELYLNHVSTFLLRNLDELANIKHIKVRGGQIAMQKFFFCAKKINFTRLESLEIIVRKVYGSIDKKFFFCMKKRDERWTQDDFYLNMDVKQKF